MRWTRVATWCAVPAGFVAAHVLAFVVSHPDRPWSALDAACGGAPIFYTAMLCLALVGGAGLVVFGSGYRGERFEGSVARTAIPMVSLFGLVEIAEHLAGRAQALQLDEPAVWVGLLAQLLVAVVLTWFLQLAHRCGEIVGQAEREGFEARPVWRSAHRLPIVVDVASAPSARAPPWLG